MNVTANVPPTDNPKRCLEAIAAADDPPEETIVVATPHDAGSLAARNMLVVLNGDFYALP